MNIKFYGTSTCSDCKHSRKILDEHGVQYDYISLEENEDAAAEVVKMNGGYMSTPTIIFPNGKVLVEPTKDELM
ncbi:MAG: glutaredoxin family protein, partial [bacterium]|nr:glutaredoxin family protein [bacterium]